MERTIILKNTATEQALTMPVTPASYPMAAGRAVERLDMAQTGQIALPGLRTLFSETLEVMLPAQLYPFCTAEAVADPRYYLDLLTAWSAAGNICRYIVTGTGINAPVLIGEITYGERDGTNDVYAQIPLHEYRYLTEVRLEETQNTTRPTEGTQQSKAADTYVVVKGDSLWAICRRFYGDGALAGKLATVNGIKNPNLIYVGQVLKIPDIGTLGTAVSTAASTAVSATVSSAAKASGGSGGSDAVRRAAAAREATRKALGLD